MTLARAHSPRGTVEVAPQFPVLDALRAFGALAVLTTHVTFQAGDYTTHPIWGTVLARLDVGVAVFFVLSGFLLSRPYFARAITGLPAPTTARYLWKRFVRIYPVYAVTVVLALTLLSDNDTADAREWVRTLLLANTYVSLSFPHGLTQMWSLAAEVAFYVLLPGIMWLILGRRRAPRSGRVLLVLTALVLVSVAWHLGLADLVDQVSSGVPATWVFAHLTWFAVGIGFSWVHVRHQAGDRSAPVRAVATLGSMPGVCWTLAGGALLVSATPLAGPTLLFLPTSGQSLTKHVLYALVGGLVVLSGVFAVRDHRYARVLSAPLPRRLGHISYSTFCIHLVVLSLVWTATGYSLFRGHGLEVWLLTLLGSLVASEVLFRLVEEPAMRLKNARRGRGRSNRHPRSTASQPSEEHTEATTK
jgi:peptidoglycan/LPS O-acetylase OafA/YrhL